MTPIEDYDRAYDSVQASRSPEVLSQAAAYMSEHGMAKGRFCDNEGRVCMMGAMAAVTNSLTADNLIVYTNGYIAPHTIQLAETILRETQNDPGQWPSATTIIANYNDDPCTTQEDAILMLKRAAEQ